MTNPRDRAPRLIGALCLDPIAIRMADVQALNPADVPQPWRGCLLKIRELDAAGSWSREFAKVRSCNLTDLMLAVCNTQFTPRHIMDATNQVPHALEAGLSARALTTQARLEHITRSRAHLASTTILDAGEALRQAEAYAEEVRQAAAGTDDGICTIADAVAETRIAEEHGMGRPLPSAVLPGLNRLVGGYHPGWWLVLGARPKVGKTTFAEQEAVGQGERKRTVMFVNAELTNVQHIKRMTQREKRPKLAAEMHLAGLPVHFVTSPPGNRIDDLIGRMSIAFDAIKPDLIILDHFAELRPSAKFQREDLGLADVSTKLKDWLKARQIPGLLIAQLNRGSDNPPRRPTLSDIRECGALEQHAGAICFLFRPNMMGDNLARRDPDDDEMCEFVVSAARAGAPGIVNMAFRAQGLRFEEIDRSVEHYTWS